MKPDEHARDIAALDKIQEYMSELSESTSSNLTPFFIKSSSLIAVARRECRKRSVADINIKAKISEKANRVPDFSYEDGNAFDFL